MISIDPGLDNCGVAWWFHGELQGAFTVKGHETLTDAAGWSYIADKVYERMPPETIGTGHVLVYEMPQLIAKWRKGDPNAILQVAGAAGMILAALTAWRNTGVLSRNNEGRGEIISVRPSEWTKSKPKTANHRKMWSRLNYMEQQSLSTSLELPAGVLLSCIENGDEADAEHALDAVCIGLYALQRFGKYG